MAELCFSEIFVSKLLLKLRVSCLGAPRHETLMTKKGLYLTLCDAKHNILQQNYTNNPGLALQTSAGKLTYHVADNITDPLLPRG